MLYKAFRSVAFQLDPEFVHDLSFKMFKHFPLISSSFFEAETSDLYAVQVGALTWSFPVGLAAGLDKNAAGISFFSRLLFGAIEVGTVTPRPQEGNHKPRLFRLKSEHSLLNRMGFNNDGMEVVLANIQASNKNRKLIGINLGKNKVTPQEKAIDDYYQLYQKLAGDADYLVVNVSSPNTPGLRDLQDKGFLSELFRELSTLREQYPRPLYLKISPDMEKTQLSQVLEVVKEFHLEGVIATNTTIMPSKGEGGVSGELLYLKAKQVREEVLDLLRETPNIQLIGVGGISKLEHLIDFWKAGGKVAQVYTSFIYQGPDLLRNIKEDLDQVMKKYSFESLEQMIQNIHEVKL